MMALSGVRISWLTLARNSDFCALASSAARFDDSSSPSVFLNAVMSRRTAQNLRSGPSLTRPTVMNSGMIPPRAARKKRGGVPRLPHPAEDLAAVVEEARDAVGPEAFEVVERGAVTLGRGEDDEALARDLVLIVAEQRLGGTVERQDAAGVVEDDDAVGRGIEDRGKLP